MTDEIASFFAERTVHTDKNGRWYGTLNDAIEAAAHEKQSGGDFEAYAVKIRVRVHHSPSHIVGWQAVVDPLI